MKKILVITSRFPYPVIGGDRLRIYEICKELSKNYLVTLASLCETKEEMKYYIRDNVFVSIHRSYHPKWISYINTFFALFKKKPLQVAYYESKKFKFLVDKLVDSHDLVIPHLVRVAEYVKDKDLPKIIEMTDAISMNYTRISDVKNNAGIKGAIFKFEKNRVYEYERDIAKYFDYNVFVSQYDKDFLYKNAPDIYSKSIVCSNGVELSKHPYNFIPGGNKIIFIGNMYSVQNFDAAFWFSKNVLPLLKNYDNYEFHIIGRISEESTKKLKRIAGVVVVGAVDSIAEHASGAVAGICSVRLAAGIQNKILEYMALGIPAITSSIGLEGLFAKDQESILVADDQFDYVRHILKLKDDHEYAMRIAQNGYQYVKDNHSWSSKLKPLVDSINQLLQ